MAILNIGNLLAPFLVNMLSIIIPTLNEEKYLPRLLKSIKQQSFSNYEIIVSDGYSEDKTEDIAKQYGCNFISDKKRSPAHQRNRGAQVAKGDTLLFLDADVVLPANFLQKAYQEFRKRNLKVAGFYLRFNSKKKFYRLFELSYNLGSFFAQYFFPASVGVGIMSDRKKHFQVGAFDEKIFIGEDYDYIKRLSKKGRYRMIKSSFIYFSVRRLEKDGVISTLFKWIKSALYFILIGPIKRKIVDYDFGRY